MIDEIFYNRIISRFFKAIQKKLFFFFMLIMNVMNIMNVMMIYNEYMMNI